MNIMVKLIIIVAFCGVVGSVMIYLLNYLQAKFSSKPTLVEKLDILKNIVRNAVINTNQTYVNVLKEQGKFNKEEQKVAYTKTFAYVMNIIKLNGYEILSELVGDIGEYVDVLIESYVSQNKTSYLDDAYLDDAFFASCLDNVYKDENAEVPAVDVTEEPLEETDEIKK